MKTVPATDKAIADRVSQGVTVRFTMARLCVDVGKFLSPIKDPFG
jgi:hypothetical protein